MIKNTIFQINFFSHKKKKKNQFEHIPYYFSKSYNTSDEVLKSSSNQKLIFFLFPFYQARKMVIFNCLHWLVTRFWYFPNYLYIITKQNKLSLRETRPRLLVREIMVVMGQKTTKTGFLSYFLLWKSVVAVLLRHCNTYRTNFFHISEYKYHLAKIRVCGTIASMPKYAKNMLLCKVMDELIRREKES